MEKKFSPNMLLRQTTPQDELMSKLLAFNQAPSDAQQMVMEQKVPAAQAPTSPMSAPQQMAASPMAAQSVSRSISSEYLSPEDEAQRQNLLKLLEDERLKNQEIQNSGVKSLEEDLGKYQSQKLDYDLRPIAAMIDQATESNTYKLAEDMIVDTPETKRQKLMQMKEKLQGLKGNISKDQLAYLKEQLNSVNDKIKLQIAEKRYDKQASDADKRLSDIDGRLAKRQLADYGKQVRPLMAINSSFRGVEDALGFNINEFDEATGTVRGEKTDAPGINVPILGRINQGTSQGRQFKARLAALTNIVLKERSGASVTTQEQARIMDEFANGKLKFNTEADMLAALKEFARRLENDIQDVGAGFDPEIPEMYQGNQQQLRVTQKRESGAPSGVKKPTFEEWKKSKGF